MQDNKSIDSTQIKLIHIAINQLKIDDETYRSWLGQWFDVYSCKELTYEQASTLIDEFKKMGFKIVRNRRPRRPQAPNMVQMVSPQELAKIKHLKADIKWRFYDGYYRWLKKYLKKDHITTSKEASRVIEALKSMRDRQERQEKFKGVQYCKDGGPF